MIRNSLKKMYIYIQTLIKKKIIYYNNFKNQFLYQKNKIFHYKKKIMIEIIFLSVIFFCF